MFLRPSSIFFFSGLEELSYKISKYKKKREKNGGLIVITATEGVNRFLLKPFIVALGKPAFPNVMFHFNV